MGIIKHKSNKSLEPTGKAAKKPPKAKSKKKVVK